MAGSRSGAEKNAAMMTDDDAKNFLRIAKWFIAKDKKTRRNAMLAGGFNEVIQQSFSGVARAREKGIPLTTATVNNVRWQALRMAETALSRRRAEDADCDLYKIAERRWMFDSLVHSELKQAVNRILQTISCREREILELRSEGHTHSQIASALGVTKERIRQIEQRGIRKLQHPSRSTQLIDFVDYQWWTLT